MFIHIDKYATKEGNINVVIEGTSQQISSVRHQTCSMSQLQTSFTYSAITSNSQDVVCNFHVLIMNRKFALCHFIFDNVVFNNNSD